MIVIGSKNDWRSYEDTLSIALCWEYKINIELEPSGSFSVVASKSGETEAIGYGATIVNAMRDLAAKLSETKGW